MFKFVYYYYTLRITVDMCDFFTRIIPIIFHFCTSCIIFIQLFNLNLQYVCVVGLYVRCCKQKLTQRMVFGCSVFFSFRFETIFLAPKSLLSIILPAQKFDFNKQK